jgi:hypothetical protein
VRGVEFVLVCWVFGVIVLGSYTLLLLNIMRRRSPAFFEEKKDSVPQKLDSSVAFISRK